MKIACFDSKRHDREFLSKAAGARPEDEWIYFENRLTIDSAEQARGYDAVCVFVHDALDRVTIEKLADLGVRLIALRCAGFNNVDLQRPRSSACVSFACRPILPTPLPSMPSA